MSFPTYDYAGELATPADLRIGRGGGFGQIGDAIAGVNYYFDSVGFGDATGFAKMWGNRQFSDQKPLGVQFFAKTGRRCSNGEPMYEYISTIPKGDILGQRIKTEIERTGLPPLKGLAVGALEDARDALNPAPFFAAISDPGDQKCRKLRARVGDARGRLSSPKDPKNVWVTGPTIPDSQGMPTQEFWVKEGFSTQTPEQAQKLKSEPVLAGILLGVLVLGILFVKKK